MAQNQRRLAKGAKGEAVADIVREGDQVRARLEKVRQKGNAVGGLGVDELKDLGHLDDGGGGDDADAEALGDGELEAFCVFNVHVEQESFVAFVADDGDAEVANGRREVVRDGLYGGSKSVHGDGLAVDEW